jgi:membrane-bound lytic murein transglycosylase B
MQFLPSTWKHYGVDGNGDGVADITNVNDAIFSAANYLKACGYPNIKSALWGYNPSTRYYTKVMTKAQSFGL